MNPTFLFIILGVLGIVILYPITPRYFPETKKFWITCGLILAHIGLYGLLWLHTHKVAAVSLFLVEGGAFLVWDPFSLCPEIYRKIVRVVGDILFGLGIILSLSYFTKFPLWLWSIPAMGLLLPYLIPPLHQYIKLILALSLALMIAYLGVIGLRIYRQFYPLSQLEISLPVENQLVVPLFQPEPKPHVSQLEEENRKLKQENTSLKEEIEQLKLSH